jgi:hypothetical protein
MLMFHFNVSSAADCVQCPKLNQHLSLLRSEFVKCQQERDAFRRDNMTMEAVNGGARSDTFAGRLLKAVADMEGQTGYR